jgi:signal transduction histidine kinase
VFQGEAINYRKNGEPFPLEWQVAPLRDAGGKITHFVAIQRDITERKRAQAELESIHKQLLEASRRSGMAEIATNVLHNVGNVLNSVNVSASLAVESMKKSEASGLARAVKLIREHESELGPFLTGDPRGKLLPTYLAQLSENLLANQEATVKELDSLRENIEHIKEIVTVQQSYASVSGLKEIVNVSSLVEDSLRMNVNALNRHGIVLKREFQEVPAISIDKHKVLQILVNLVRNAKYACEESGRTDKQLTVRVANGGEWLDISVIDNGVGVPRENLTRIFNHGFTTRKDGHGFGLHGGALAAKEMGGSLTVQSEGPGRGASFTLKLPSQHERPSHG